MVNSRKNLLMEKIDDHLRKTARQLVKFDTLAETLHYLTESFWKKFTCDYVSIILKEGNLLRIKFEKGDSRVFSQILTMEEHDFSPVFLTSGVAHLTEIREDQECKFHEYLKHEQFSNWFTVPIKESDADSLGICVIGYRKIVPFVVDNSVEKLFLEFGKDIATSIGVAIHKERERQRIRGIDWLKENIYLGSSIEQLIKNIVERAGNETNADSAVVYLFDEDHNHFIFQPPAYGPSNSAVTIKIHDDFHLFNHFSYLEKAGGPELTIPLMVNLKAIGILHVMKSSGLFTDEDKKLLQFLCSHVSVLVENARLYKNELEAKSRLEKLVLHNQELIKQTVIGEDCSEITVSLSRMIHCSVMLFDRFFRPIASSIVENDIVDIEQISIILNGKIWDVIQNGNQEQWLWLNDQLGEYGLWKVVGGKALHAYLVLKLHKNDLDLFVRMAVNQSLNVYAIQFIKQKLVLDAKEQIKDSFINQLLVEKLEDRNKIVQYSSLFNFNIQESHKIGLLSLEFNGSFYREDDLLSLETSKTWIWEKIREKMAVYDPDIKVTRKDSYYILFVPAKKENEYKDFWELMYAKLKQLVSRELKGIEIFLGISKQTEKLEDYFHCYKQALQALKIVCQRYRSKGFLCFNGLGSYKVLHNLQDSGTASLFIREYLDPLLEYVEGGNKDLFDTLYVYLRVSGNLKDTAEHLHIHRNTLKYRLGKISELLKLNIEDAEIRFNLMLAYKLYDLYLSSE